MIRRAPALITFVPAILAAAMLCAPLLPQEHVHRAGMEGRTEAVVHAHASDGEGGGPAFARTPAFAAHGDHAVAMFLDEIATAAARAFALTGDTAGTLAAIGPGLERAGVAPRSPVVHPIHGPPGRRSAPRAPPFAS